MIDISEIDKFPEMFMLYNGVVSNCDNNYKMISDYLLKDGNILIAWGDKSKTTQYDILFLDTVDTVIGTVQGGIRPHYLYISIIKNGAFAFRKDITHSAQYVSEKLFIDSLTTAQEIVDLINGIIKQLGEIK